MMTLQTVSITTERYSVKELTCEELNSRACILLSCLAKMSNARTF